LTFLGQEKKNVLFYWKKLTLSQPAVVLYLRWAVLQMRAACEVGFGGGTHVDFFWN